MPTLEEIKKRKQYITYANQTEEKYGLPKNLLVGVMGAESNFNPNAVSHVGAKGLMQFMKATAQEYGINPLNPSESINAAGKYLQSSYKKFGNWEDALRSYNMGVGGLQKVKAGKKSLPKETKDYVGRVYKYAGIKYEDPSYVNTSPQDNNQVQETITPTLNYFNIPKEITTFASVPDSAKEDKKETVEDGVTSKDVAEVEQKTKEYNFLEELQKEDYSHLQPEQVAQQQIVPKVDFNQQFEQVSQFIDEPLVAQQGLTWQEKLANRPRKPTVAEIIAEGDARKAQQRVQTDNIPNTKRDLSLMLAEHNNIKKDEQELRTTGQIKNPNSIQYRRNVKTQPDIKQDDISTEQRNAQLNPLERPLIYLANPSKLLGDIGIPNMETSELDRQAISSNRFNPNQTRTQRLENQVKLGLGYVPEATVNTALAASFMPEGSGALGLVNEALNPLAGLKTSIPDSMKQGLNSQGFLDIFKSNPKFNIKDDHFYRSIGADGVDDALSSGSIRSKQVGDYAGKNPYFVEGTDFEKLHSTGAGATSNKPEYIFEMPMVDKSGEIMTANRVNQNSGYVPYVADKNQIPLSEGSIYKLNSKGEYEVFNTPNIKDNFKSEINWGKWNKEIPENTQLIKEYNTIEQQAKANNTWMKNPDGSTFQGTPEQFVQQNSENFKKSFGNSKLINPDGSPEINYHSTYNDLFDTFDINKFDSSTNDGGWYGKGFYTSPNKKWANRFGDNTLEGYLNIKNPVPNDLEVFFGRNGYGSTPELGKFDIRDKLKNYDGVVTSPNNPDIERVFNNPSSFKSATGNNGMFDMNNPNIYKSIAPIAGASYLATQGQEEPKKLQQGGEFSENELAFLSEIAIKDNNGYWNKDNQGKVVEIDGNQITMKGVDQDLIGIGIDKKGKKTEQKTMKAGKNYNFDKAIKVIEIPLFKK